MTTVTTETQDPGTILIADDETSFLTLLIEIRHSVKTLNVIEQARTIDGDTRLVPVLR